MTDASARRVVDWRPGRVYFLTLLEPSQDDRTLGPEASKPLPGSLSSAPRGSRIAPAPLPMSQMWPRSRPGWRCPLTERPVLAKTAVTTGHSAAFLGAPVACPRPTTRRSLATICSQLTSAAPQRDLSAPGQPCRHAATASENPSHHDHLVGAGPAVDVHGRVVTANRRAAARYRQAPPTQSPADELGAPPHRSGPRRSHRQCQAADLLREHLAGIGCDPLAFRIAAIEERQFPPRRPGRLGDFCPWEKIWPPTPASSYGGGRCQRCLRQCGSDQ
jgi:hypothetical protein